jgi:hypothetical protein
MAFANPWDAPGSFVKAQLHCHTTCSDGKLPPGWVAENLYRCGYGVLAITDHDTVTPPPEFARPDFCYVPGVEIGSPGPTGRGFHMVMLGLTNEQRSPEGTPVVDVLRNTKEAGGFAFIAHPYWSSLTAQDMTGLADCTALEVYNHGCEIEIGKGISSVHLDDCLRLGDRYLPIAVDDAHLHGFDVLGGWTWLRLREHSTAAVLEALKSGLYYSSMGPEIHSLSFDGSEIRVECSPARWVRFMAAETGGWTEGAWGRPPLTRGRYVVSGRERYVRVEVIDEAGRHAWAPPIFLG